MAAHREIALLTNPHAGKGRGTRTAAIALPRLREAGITVHSLVGRDADEALDLARASVADGVDSLVVVGGDGMVHLAVQALVGSGTSLGIIPAGTGNDVARYVDIPRSDPQLAADVVVGARTRRIDLARVRRHALRHRDGGRLRRGRQRAGQRDALAAGPDALQPGHARRAAGLRAAALHARARRRGAPARRDAGRGRQRAVLRRRAADHAGRPARRRLARRGHHQADEQARPGPDLPAAVHRAHTSRTRSTSTTWCAR